MPLRVLKFGGTSVESPERLLSVAQRIEAMKHEGNDLIVVVSAMGQTTDELITLASKVSKSPSHREMDMLLTTGERISMALLSMALSDCGVTAVSFTGSQSGIITDASHRRAKIRKILGDRIRKSLEEGKVVIVAGFQGVSETKEITTLGRGGSDTTAVALAAKFGAEVCEIYKDVDGIYSADPRIVKNAQLRGKLDYKPVIELAYRGAGVLHPRCVELAYHYGITVRVQNSLSQNPGTEVLGMEKGMEDYRIIGITADSGRVLLCAEGMKNPLAILEAAAAGNLSAISLTMGPTAFRAFIEKEALTDWDVLLKKTLGKKELTSYQIEEDTIPLSIVGERFAQDPAALAAVFTVLQKNNIPTSGCNLSALSITIAISSKQADAAVQKLHEALIDQT